VVAISCCLGSRTVHALLRQGEGPLPRQGEGQEGRKRLGQQPSHVTSGSARYMVSQMSWLDDVALAIKASAYMELHADCGGSQMIRIEKSWWEEYGLSENVVASNADRSVGLLLTCAPGTSGSSQSATTISRWDERAYLDTDACSRARRSFTVSAASQNVSAEPGTALTYMTLTSQAFTRRTSWPMLEKSSRTAVLPRSRSNHRLLHLLHLCRRRHHLRRQKTPDTGFKYIKRWSVEIHSSSKYNAVLGYRNHPLRSNTPGRWTLFGAHNGA
jgi:hypothetical protein